MSGMRPIKPASNAITKYLTILLRNTPVVCATILDPCFKLNFFALHEATLARFGTSTNHLAKIFQDEAKKHFTAPSDLPNNTQNIPMAGLFDELYTSSIPDSNSLETKLQQFFAEPPEVKSTDILLFWKSRGTIFPTLTQMACKYLSIPATSAPLERVFSCGRKILTYQ
ncbi:hypothetical protein O181_030171 [Austropuccinia psidii MF-1]|uniref:HAT C-terminal dimerisation domain-containing protein n=1 Tax=Austropuccinia psidii MF-1 TaxID=1389203 RepID=A0A9Q3CSG2_9BASI|nr:hypothetical protein [Austropuccinia psidii MF-1]